MKRDGSNFPGFATNWPDPEQTVGDAVARMLQNAQQQLQSPEVAIATAYFNIGGYALLADALDGADAVRLLIGAEPEPTPPRSGLAPVTETEAVESHEQWLRHARDLLGFTRDSDAATKRLVDWLRAAGLDGAPKVQVRRYTRGFLHGKVFMSHAGDIGTVLVGSSNFTYAGLAKNAELMLGHAEFGGGTKVEMVKEWFDHFWQESEPYDLAGLYDQRWRPHTPWVVFLRMLHELYGSQLDEEQAGPTRFGLTSFQQDGVRRAERLMEELGGALVADEVGLGKTYIAGEIIHAASMEARQRVLILCPAALRDGMWDGFLERHGFTRRVKVMSYADFRGRCEADHRNYDEFMAELDDYSLVVVDEAHNLRNSGARQSKALSRLLGGKNPKKVLLLTATPVSNSLHDLDTLIGYFVRNDATFAGVGIPSISGYIRNAQRIDPENLTPQHLFDLMDRVAVRRTRKFVRRHYPNATIQDGQGNEMPIVFPESEIYRIDYTLDAAGAALMARVVTALSLEDDQGIVARYQDRRVDPDRLMLSRYAPSGYAMDGNLEQYQVNNAGLLRSQLLKRLESSPYALRQTLATLIGSHEQFLTAFDQGYVLRGKALSEWANSDSDDIQAVVDGLGEDRRDLAVPVEKFHAQALKEDVAADLALLRSLLADAEGAAEASDPKAQRLIEELELISSLSKKPAAVASGDRRKVLIFSTYTDTVEDLHKQVSAALDAAADDSPLAAYKGRLAPVMSGKRSGDAVQAEVVKGFAPNQAHNEHAQDKYDILITTDVLSEGVNLQQAGRIINYDLPWNPMRIVQRHGRIDRIGSSHTRIHLGLFSPDALLDELLNLQATLQRKQAYAAAAIGQEAVLPGSKSALEVNYADKMEIDDAVDEEQRIIRDLLAGDARALDRGEKALSGEEFRRRLFQAFEDRMLKGEALDLPYGSGSGFVSDNPNLHGYVFCARVDGYADPKFVFMPTDGAWNPRFEADGRPVLITSALNCLTFADPGDESRLRDLPDEAMDRAFDAWQLAQGRVHSDWQALTDPAKFMPEVPLALRDAYDLLQGNPAQVAPAEFEDFRRRLNTSPPRAVQVAVRQIVDDATLAPADKQVAIAEELEDAGIQPAVVAAPLKPITMDQVRLVCWLAVSPGQQP